MIFQGLSGCKQVQMGADGCGWVRQGTGVWANRKTRQVYMYIDIQHMIFGLMAGKFPQNIIFMRCRHKGEWVGAYGKKRVQMGAVGYIITGGAQNNTKIYINGSARQYLVTHVHGNKTRLTLGWQKNRSERIIRIILNN